MPTLQGFVPGQRYAAGSAYPQGMSFGTPRDWSHGGDQMYDPRFTMPLKTEGGTMQRASTYGNQQPPFRGGAAGNGTPGTSSMRPATGLAWQQPTDIFAGNMGGFGNINTSIIPRAPYSADQTRAATNQAVAAHHASGNINDIMKRFDSPGISRGAAHVSRALPIAAQANAAARRTRAQLPLEDFLANAQSITGGQAAREQEAQALAQLALRNQSQQQQFQQRFANQQLQNFGAGFNVLDAFGLN